MREKLIQAALDEIGVKEIPGPVGHSPRILEYFAEIGHEWVKADETAWCSAVHNFIHKVKGYEWSGELTARSWLNRGVSVRFSSAMLHPEKGDTVIFWRGTAATGGGPNGWKGHVGFFIRQRGKWIYTLGGNQNNEYCIKPYPEYKLLDIRRMRKKI